MSIWSKMTLEQKKRHALRAKERRESNPEAMEKYRAYHNVYHKQYCSTGLKVRKTRKKRSPKDLAISVAKWRKRNPEKTKAHRAVFVAVRNGSLKRRNCFCGNKGQAHHEDYSKPLEVMWLCKEHHVKHDARRREREKSLSTGLI